MPVQHIIKTLYWIEPNIQNDVEHIQRRAYVEQCLSYIFPK